MDRSPPSNRPDESSYMLPYYEKIQKETVEVRGTNNNVASEIGTCVPLGRLERILGLLATRKFIE